MSLSKQQNIPLSQIQYPVYEEFKEQGRPRKPTWYGPEPTGYNRPWRYNPVDNSIQMACGILGFPGITFFYDAQLEDYYSDEYLPMNIQVFRKLYMHDSSDDDE